MPALDLIRHLELGPGATPSSAFDEQRPAAALLKRLSAQWDAINHCRNKFPKKLSGELTKASANSPHVACSAVFATMMSEVETFQRVLYAGCFEFSAHIPAYDPKEALKKIDKKELSPTILAGYRGASASVGRLLADSLTGWHNPASVNSFLHAFALRELFDPIGVTDLTLMWQFRHSIVHTGGWITRPDSQKLAALTGLADRPIIVGFPFIDSATRRLYRTISNSVTAYGTAYIARLDPSTPATVWTTLTNLFDVAGPRPAWI